jgi:hypothetical protein
MNLIEEEIDIETFIKKFNKYEKNEVLLETFTQGFCYYFALILHDRYPEGIIYYNTDNHFALKMDDKIYDITGECQEKWKYRGKWYSWNEYQSIESLESKGIIRDCIKINNVYP